VANERGRKIEFRSSKGLFSTRVTEFKAEKAPKIAKTRKDRAYSFTV
jgi:hypothetical protein